MTEWLGTKARIGHEMEPLGCSQIRCADVKVCETPKHVAEIGGWSLRQVQKWCADGTLPAMMIGGTWAINGQKICDMLGIED